MITLSKTYPAPKLIPAISASRINDWRGCKRRHLYSVLLKAYPQEEKIYTSRGVTLHKLVECYLMEGVWGYAVVDLASYAEYFAEELQVSMAWKSDAEVATLLSKRWPSNAAPASDRVKATIFHYLKHFKEWGEDARTLAEPAANLFSDLRSAFGDKIQAEQGIYLNRVGKQVSQSYGAYSMANIDFLAVDGTSATVIDWKSGKFSPAYTGDAEFQADLYAVHVFLANPLLTEVNWHVMYPFTTPRGSVSGTMVRGDQRYLEAAGTIDQYHQEISAFWANRDEGKMPPTKNGLCKAYCPVIHCEFNGKRHD